MEFLLVSKGFVEHVVEYDKFEKELLGHDMNKYYVCGYVLTFLHNFIKFLVAI